MRKKVYVSGKMSGVKDHNFPEFNRVTALLRNEGYIVINPAEFGVIEGWSWEDYMKKDIAELVYVDIVATLDNWEDSEGARLEVYIAKELGIEVIPYRELI